MVGSEDGGDTAPRPTERDLAGVVDLVAFGAALRRVRRHRGLTLRGMEQHLKAASGRPGDRWSKSKIDLAEKGHQLDERWVLRYLSAAGVPGPELPPWVMALRRALEPATGVPAPSAPATNGTGSDATAGTRPETSPYPGLSPFDAQRHHLFFARDKETRELVELLHRAGHRAQGTVLVVGPSGCGKSSLVRAGLVPAMAEEPGWWTPAPFWPGRDPTTALARELALSARSVGLAWTLGEVNDRLDADGLGTVAEELLLAAPGPRRDRLLLVVDQYEELLTLAAAEARARFARLLAALPGGPVTVVGTLSPEFLDPLLSSPELGALPTRVVTVRPLARDALTVVVEGPARRCGLAVDPELTARLVADTGGGDALPLLAYTLSRLAEGVGHDGRLSARRYEELGGVHGTLTRAADEARADAARGGRRGSAAVVDSLLRLVTIDEQGHPTRRRSPIHQLPPAVWADLQPFLERRLLTTGSGAGATGSGEDENGDGGAVVEVAHEAFLSVWTPLAEAIARNATALRARRAVEQAATVWASESRTPGRLFERGQLAAALADTGARTRPWWSGSRDVVVERVAVSPLASEFLGAAVRRDRLRRGRATGVLALLLALALVATGVAVAQLHSARDQQRLATARQLVAQAEGARDTDQRAALLLGEAAHHLYPAHETRASLVQTLLANRYSATLDGHRGSVRFATFSPDGRTAVTAGEDDAIILWNVADPTAPRQVGPPLSDRTGPISLAAFSPDGRTLVTQDADDRSVVLWDVTVLDRPQRGATLVGAADTADVVTFSPDGRTLALGNGDSTTTLWDLSDPRRPRPGATLVGHTRLVFAMAFSPDGRTLATGSDDATTILWDLTDPAGPRRGATLTGHTGYVNAVAFSPDGRTLATGGADATTLLWDVRDRLAPRLDRTLTGHTSLLHAVAFSPDGRTLATASEDATTILWDLTATGPPRRVATLAGHTARVYVVAFSPDGRTLLTGGSDSTGILWNVANPGQPRPRTTLADPGAGLGAVASSPDGRTLATGSGDGTATLWEVTERDPPRMRATLAGHGNAVGAVAFSPDGRVLATGSDDTTTILWDVSDPDRPRRAATLTGHDGYVLGLAWSPDGRTLAAVAAGGGRTIVWSVDDPDRPTPRATLGGHTSSVRAVAFAPDGETLATGGDDETTILWDLTVPGPPRPSATLTGHTGSVYDVAFAPDGSSLATGSADASTILWDLTGPDEPRTAAVLAGSTRDVSAVRFSPDGRTLAAASLDGTAVLWDVAVPGPPLRGPTLAAHASGVTALDFVPDGRTLVTASNDASAVVWDNLTGWAAIRDRTVPTACALTQGGIGPADWARVVPDLPYEDTCPAG